MNARQWDALTRVEEEFDAETDGGPTTAALRIAGEIWDALKVAERWELLWRGHHAAARADECGEPDGRAGPAQPDAGDTAQNRDGDLRGRLHGVKARCYGWG